MRRLYAYVGNDPLNGVDPSGNCPLCISAAIGAVAGGVGGGLAAFHSTGSWFATIGGVATGAVVGGGIGLNTPRLIETTGAAGAAAGAAVGGTFGSTVGSGVGTGVGIVAGGVASGAVGAAAADYTVSGFPGAQIDPANDIRNGMLVGGVAALPQALATGVIGASTVGTAESLALGTNTGILGTLGSVATTCSIVQGCGLPAVTTSPPPGSGGNSH